MILEKDEIKSVFDPRYLLPGDILLMNTYAERLRKAMECVYEHAAIYIGDGFMMEANGAHVVMTHIYSYAFKDMTHALVLRLKDPSQITLENIARNARKQMGRQYVNMQQYKYIREYKNSDRQDDTNHSFCSRLVAQAYEDENIKLVPNADYCEPDDFMKSDRLEIITNGIMPFCEDVEQAVMCNQKKRDLYEFDSPNAELFKELGKLYGENIQDLSQALKPSLSRPELNDQAIRIIKQSRMFKHMEDVKRDTPWVFDDEEFLNHYPATKDALHFLYSNFEHYDNTFIPCYRQLHAQLTVFSNYNKDNTLLKFMQEYISKMVEEAIVCRKRFAELFRMVSKERREDTVKFIEKYGRYPEIDYIPKVLDISFLVDDVLKAFERHRE